MSGNAQDLLASFKNPQAVSFLLVEMRLTPVKAPKRGFLSYFTNSCEVLLFSFFALAKLHPHVRTSRSTHNPLMLQCSKNKHIPHAKVYENRLNTRQKHFHASELIISRLKDMTRSSKTAQMK